MYEIQDVTVPKQYTYRKTAKYPFAKLEPGQGFKVSDPAEMKRVRVAASRFNARNPTKRIACYLDNGVLTVFRVDPSATVGNHDDSGENPTMDQFKGFLATMQPGQSFTMTDPARFQQFERWIVETGLNFETNLNQDSLTITRKDDAIYGTDRTSQD
jgi:hypothetical protein